MALRVFPALVMVISGVPVVVMLKDMVVSSIESTYGFSTKSAIASNRLLATDLFSSTGLSQVTGSGMYKSARFTKPKASRKVAGGDSRAKIRSNS